MDPSPNEDATGGGSIVPQVSDNVGLSSAASSARSGTKRKLVAVQVRAAV